VAWSEAGSPGKQELRFEGKQAILSKDVLVTIIAAAGSIAAAI